MDILSEQTKAWIAKERHHIEGVPHEPCLRRALIGDFDRLVALAEAQGKVVEAARPFACRDTLASQNDHERLMEESGLTRGPFNCCELRTALAALEKQP